MISVNREIKQRFKLHRELALAGILGPLMFGLVPLILAPTVPGYNPVKETLSALALTSRGWVQTLAFCVFGLLLMLFSLGLYTGVTKKTGLKISSVIIFLLGVGFLLLSVFPTDSSATTTFTGNVHKNIVYGLGLLFPAACFLLLPSLKADPRWKGLVIYTAITGSLVLFFIIGWIYLNVSGLVHSILGLYERIFIWSATIWVEVMAIRLLFLPHLEPAIERKITKVPRYAVIGVSVLLALSGYQITRYRSRQQKKAFSSLVPPFLFSEPKASVIAGV